MKRTLAIVAAFLVTVPAKLALETPYTRSFELMPEPARGAVLLVHGVSDSPYAMRAIATVFCDQGFYFQVLRLPGHYDPLGVA